MAKTKLFEQQFSQEKAKFVICRGSFQDLEIEKVKQVYGIVLNPQNQILLVHNLNSGWGLVGGKIETGETLLQCLEREVYEESAVVLDLDTIEEAFYQEVYFQTDSAWELDSYQIRFIARIKEINEFVSDPAGGVDAVRWVEIDRLSEVLEWGQTTELIVEIVRSYIKKPR